MKRKPDIWQKLSGYFPLTPALSPGERENVADGFVKFASVSCVSSRGLGGLKFW
jgi:hypothetical protein